MATSLQSYLPSRPALGVGVEPAFGRVRSLMRHLASSFVEARRKRAEAEVASYIERRGGRLTDDLERQIERRFGPAMGS